MPWALQYNFVDSTDNHYQTDAGGIWWQCVESNDSTRSHQNPTFSHFSHHIPPYPTNIMRLGVLKNVLMRLKTTAVLCVYGVLNKGLCVLKARGGDLAAPRQEGREGGNGGTCFAAALAAAPRHQPPNLIPVQVTVQVQMQVLLPMQVPVQVPIQVPTQVPTEVRMPRCR
jgi:hypothetical protein